MNLSEFEADPRHEGYMVFYGSLPADEVIPEQGLLR
jgi:hypothetical protein